MGKSTAKTMPVRYKRKNKFLPGRDMPIYLMLLPAIILVFVFCYLPIYGVCIGFQDYSPYRGIRGSEWVGLKNFATFIQDSNFWRVMKNTLVINFYQITFGFPFPIIFALLLNELRYVKLKKAIQTISYLPHFLSWVIVASIVTTILSPEGGLINLLLESIGLEPVYFLVKSEYFRPIIVLSAMWKSFGLKSVYYLAALSSIDQSLYEAASIDGANRLRQTWHITLPGIKSIAIVLLVLQVGAITSIGFEQIFLLYNPMVYDVGDVISTYTYRLGIEQTRFSLTTAIGFTQSIVNFILVVSTNYLSRKITGWALW